MHPEDVDFRALIESASDLILVADEHGFVFYASPAAEQSVGYAPEELVGHSLLTMVHPRDAQRAIAVLRAASEREWPGALIECRLRRKDGSWRVFDMRVDALEAGAAGALRVLISCRDFTARSHSARQNRLAQSLLRSQNPAIQEAVLVLSSEGDILHCNPEFLSFWRIDPATNPLRCDVDVWSTVLRQLDDPGVFLRTVCMVAVDPARSHRLQLRTRLGAVIECYTASIDSLPDEEASRVWRFRDITDQQRLQEQLARAQKLVNARERPANESTDPQGGVKRTASHKS